MEKGGFLLVDKDSPVNRGCGRIHRDFHRGEKREFCFHRIQSTFHREMWKTPLEAVRRRRTILGKKKENLQDYKEETRQMITGSNQAEIYSYLAFTLVVISFMISLSSMSIFMVFSIFLMELWTVPWSRLPNS